jgi:hypothetical protein
MAASVKREAAPVDLSAAAVTALEEALEGKPRSLMIVAEYRNRRVRVFSVPDSAAVELGLHCMSEPLIIPESKGDEGEDE